MKLTITDEYGFDFEVIYEAYLTPQEGDGWYDPIIPGHWEVEVEEVWQIDETGERCCKLDITDEFLMVICSVLQDDAIEQWETAEAEREWDEQRD